MKILSIEELLSRPYRSQILPYPRYYDWHTEGFFGFYKDRWSIERNRELLKIGNYDTGYTDNLPKDAIIRCVDDGEKRADGLPFATLHLRYQLHLWRDYARWEPLSDSYAQWLPWLQRLSPELLFDFSPWRDRLNLQGGDGMKGIWAGMFPQADRLARTM